jgi:hypothetical protein
VIASNEEANAAYISAATEAMGDVSLAMQNKIDWGMSYADLKKQVSQTYINDTGQYLSWAFFADLPSDEGWLDEDGNMNADHFISTDILSYYVVDKEIGLYEYGYLAPDANLYQYDFLKAYYTSKYGEPGIEEWEWNDSSYQPDGSEDYYQMFQDGLVKVMAVWDVEELDTVLVVDWLNDPAQYDNNYGQISFYLRSEDFSLDNYSDTDS